MSKDIILNGETADLICCESMKQHIQYITEDIEAAMKLKSLTGSQATELGCNISLLESMKVVYGYYGGKELTFDSTPDTM